MESYEDIYYSRGHLWVKLIDDEASIGITDYFQERLGDIVYIDLPFLGDDFKMGDSFAALESVSSSVDLYCPLTGLVLELNEDLELDPTILNEDPDNSWLVKLEIKDRDEINDLFSESEYENYIDEENFN